MLSILIPVYNYDCSKLVTNLQKQGLLLQSELGESVFQFEIIVADDASDAESLKFCNSQLANLEGVVYIELGQNMGRAAIRNYLSRQSRYEWLLFIDCDASVCREDFVKKYWLDRKKADVVCGSLVNPPSCLPGCELRFAYERQAQKKRTMEFRNRFPYNYFSTFNVLFNRSVFQVLQFDERCKEYGFEDALMGLMLREQGYAIAHIDNPLVHEGMDSNKDFLHKVETALRTLRMLGDPMQSFSALACVERMLRKLYLIKPYCCFIEKSKGKIVDNLLSNNPKLLYLNLYKLWFYAKTAED